MAATNALTSEGIKHSEENFLNSAMCVELKTSHKQGTQPAHMAQLALYTLMLQVRNGLAYPTLERHRFANTTNNLSLVQGAASGGLLLYLNQTGIRSVHISPLLNEMKSLIGQRNLAVSEQVRASLPRGVILAYSDGEREEQEENSS